MKHNSYIEACIIAFGLLLLGLSLSYGLTKALGPERVVSVKGLAEREVEANKVTWPISYQELGNQLTEVYNIIDTKNKIVVDFLKSNGLGDDEITVNAPTLVDMNANQYSENHTGYRYNVHSSVTVSSKNVSLVRKLILRQSELLQRGVGVMGNDYDAPLVYEFTSLNEIKPEMIEEATQNARKAAEQFANDSQSHLGKIKKASQGQFSIEDRDISTPYIKKVRVVSSVDYYLTD